MRELFQHITTLEADGQKDAAQIEPFLESSVRQATTIAEHQTKLEQLEPTSAFPPSVNIKALQDDLDALRRDLDRL